MTHGGGHHGGGGGGGGHSGGSHGGGFHHHHQHHRHHHHRSNVVVVGGGPRWGARTAVGVGCCACCCCRCCSCACASFTLLGLLFLTMSVALCAIFLPTYDVNYSMAPSEQRLLHLPTEFFESYTTSSEDPRTVLYAFDERPPLTERQHFQTSWSKDLSGEEYQYDQFYLLDGSTVSPVICVDSCTPTPCTSTVVLYVFDSTDTFESWKDYDDDTYFYTSTYGSGCHTPVVELDNGSSDYYFVVYNSQRSVRVKTSAQFNVTRALYDTSSATQTCSNATRCSVTLDFASNAVALIASPPSSNPDTTTRVRWYPTSRGWFIGVLFASITGFILFLSLLTYCFCRTSHRHTTPKPLSETQSLLHHPPPPPLSTPPVPSTLPPPPPMGSPTYHPYPNSSNGNFEPPPSYDSVIPSSPNDSSFA